MNEQRDRELDELAAAEAGQISRRTLLRRAAAIGLSTPVIAGLLAACGGGDDGDTEPTSPAGEEPGTTATAEPGETPGGEAPSGDRPVLRYALDAADLGTLDPHYASSTPDRTVVDMIFNALVRYKPGDSSQFEPDLATEIPEPEIVDGKQVWTFTLRQGVMWHPGPQTESYELTADDVIFSLQKSANPDTSAYAAEYTGMTFE
jgi:peptide/nickel transport system substrate-binding protein